MQFNTTDDQSSKKSTAEKLLKLEAFGKSHQLALQPLDQQLFKGNLKMWSAESDGNGSISYTELPDVSTYLVNSKFPFPFLYLPHTYTVHLQIRYICGMTLEYV